MSNGFGELPLDDERWVYSRAVLERAQTMRVEREKASYQNLEVLVQNAVMAAIAAVFR